MSVRGVALLCFSCDCEIFWLWRLEFFFIAAQRSYFLSSMQRYFIQCNLLHTKEFKTI